MNTNISLDIRTGLRSEKTISHDPVSVIGRWSAILSLVFGLGYVAAQLLSWFKIITYPNELYWLFFPSLFLAPAFLVTMICLHFETPHSLKIWSAIGLAFALVYCVMASLTYFTQLGSMVPGVVSGEISDSHPLIFRPRSFTMSIDCLAYFFMSLSTLFTAFAFRESYKPLFAWMLLNGLLLVILVPAYFNPTLYYIGSVWAISFSMSMIYAARFLGMDSVRFQIK